MFLFFMQVFLAKVLEPDKSISRMTTSVAYMRADKGVLAEATRIATAAKADGVTKEKTFTEILTLGTAAYLKQNKKYAKSKS